MHSAVSLRARENVIIAKLDGKEEHDGDGKETRETGNGILMRTVKPGKYLVL